MVIGDTLKKICNNYFYFSENNQNMRNVTFRLFFNNQKMSQFPT